MQQPSSADNMVSTQSSQTNLTVQSILTIDPELLDLLRPEDKSTGVSLCYSHSCCAAAAADLVLPFNGGFHVIFLYVRS